MTKVIIITGAGAGIGKSCSNYFLNKNYKVALLGRNKSKLKPENAKGKNYLSIECDVSDYSKVQSVFKEIINTHRFYIRHKLRKPYFKQHRGKTRGDSFYCRHLRVGIKKIKT